MTDALDAYQQAAARTVNAALDDRQRLLDAACGLAEEAGEVLAHVRKHVMQGRALDRDALAEELGDALWCVAVTARVHWDDCGGQSYRTRGSAFAYATSVSRFTITNTALRNSTDPWIAGRSRRLIALTT